MNQWISPICAIAATAVATWIMWQSIKDAARRNVIDANRWRMIDQLHQRYDFTSVEYDDHDRVMVECRNADRDLMLRVIGANIDVALAQAVNYMERANVG